MLIDWFTVVAQAVNFLILVWLLKRFLYRPILDAIDAREQRVAAALADADEQRLQAQRERDAFRRRHEDFDRERSSLLLKATDEAKAERQRLLDAARHDAGQLAEELRAALQAERQVLGDALARGAREEVFAIARRALADLAAADLEERIAEVFVRRLRGMDAAAKGVLGEALRTATEPARVRSTFELPAAQRAAIQRAVNDLVSGEIALRFETAPELVSGVELSVNGQRVGWSVADYLAALQERVAQLLKDQGRKAAPSPAAPDAGSR